MNGLVRVYRRSLRHGLCVVFEGRQIVRSVGQWAAGVRLESSIHAAYCSLIHHAKESVYIENQFFVSAQEGDNIIGNRIAAVLGDRILRAASAKKPFKARAPRGNPPTSASAEPSHSMYQC